MIAFPNSPELRSPPYKHNSSRSEFDGQILDGRCNFIDAIGDGTGAAAAAVYPAANGTNAGGAYPLGGPGQRADPDVATQCRFRVLVVQKCTAVQIAEKCIPSEAFAGSEKRHIAPRRYCL
jgi:hypothetical protein